MNEAPSYITVRLLTGFEKTLTYEVPPELAGRDLVGEIVTVPIRKKNEPALVCKQFSERPPVSYEIRVALPEVLVPQDPHYKAYITEIAATFFTTPFELGQRLRSFVLEKESKRKKKAPDAGVLDDLAGDESDSQATAVIASEAEAIQTNNQNASEDDRHRERGVAIEAGTHHLTPEQATIATDIIARCATGRFEPVVLHGVTGSGKTEVYKALITHVVGELGQSVLFLVPEVSLARQFEAIFAAAFPSYRVYGFYSGVPTGKRRAMWQAALAGAPMLIVGVHLPVLMPLSNLGAVIVDEEHEEGFYEKNHPSINSKHAALIRAKRVGIPIVLGSATPSVTTLYHARKLGWPVYRLFKRFAGAFPVITHALLSDPHKRQHFWFTPELTAAIRGVLERGEQVIIYVNRRGYSLSAQCTACGTCLRCDACAVSLTIHGSPESGQSLLCHYCDFTAPLPSHCPQCKSVRGFKHTGVGTQKVVSMLASLFPQARVGRADTDISRKKGEWAEILRKFSSHELDILVGTQIITKGYHFPRVTLVGVLWADSSIHFPVYNGHETALQQLLQVAGRAGRVSPSSEVIIQSFEYYPLFNFLAEDRYEDFCTEELAVRELAGYPPFKRCIMLELSGEHEERLIRDAANLKEFLEKAGEAEGVIVRGPAVPLVARIANVHYRTILLKADRYSVLQRLVARGREYVSFSVTLQ